MNHNKYLYILIIVISLQLLSCKDDNGTDPKPDDIPTYPGYKLVWNDEFNGTSVDDAKWEYEVNGAGGGNNELQYYTDRKENSWVKDGRLNIAALQEEYTGPDGKRYYTSARMRTLKKGDWKYGRFEIRAKLPYGKGFWPAIWMLPTDWVYGGWPASGEIDIMELLGDNVRSVYGTLHFGGVPPANVHSGSMYTLPGGDFASQFHVFWLDWEETEMRWYVDGVQYATIKDWYSVGNSYPAPFDQRFHLILNVAVGGNWPGNPDTTSVFPQYMQVDYVRVYQKTN